MKANFTNHSWPSLSGVIINANSGSQSPLQANIQSIYIYIYTAYTCVQIPYVICVASCMMPLRPDYPRNVRLLSEMISGTGTAQRCESQRVNCLRMSVSDAKHYKLVRNWSTAAT